MAITTSSIDFQCFPLGDSVVLIQFSDGISLDTNRKIRSITAFLDEYTFEGFVECVPAFNSIAIYYEPGKVSFEELSRMIEEMMANLPDASTEVEQAIIEIPVVYGGEWGPDLDFVATYNKMTADDVISIHSQAEYLVYMIGFAPGFPYLGGMDERIATPRKHMPRTSIFSGAVGIGGKQTGVYPIESPAGWQIIGRAAVDLFDKTSEHPVLLKAGDRVRFIPIDADILIDEYGI